MTTEQILSPGKVAVVTGAASGIGKAVCRRLAAKGIKICLADLPGGDLKEACIDVANDAPRGSEDVLGVPTDVANPLQVQHLHDQVMTSFGRTQFLMNNAVTREGKGFDAEIADWRRAMEVNFWGVVNGVRAFLPTMQSATDPGMIINVGSKQGITNPPGHPIYNITKSALKTYTEALEHELRSGDGERYHRPSPGPRLDDIG